MNKTATVGVALLATIAIGGTASSTSAAAPSTTHHPHLKPGGVFVTGHDPDFHVCGDENPAGARNIIDRAIDYVTYGEISPSILLVTSDIAPPAGHVSVIDCMASAGYDVDVAGAPDQNLIDLTTVDFSDYDVVLVGSDFGGVLRQAELDILNSRAGDICRYVLHGGGLVALAESGTNGQDKLTWEGRFDFLPVDVTEDTEGQFETAFSVTRFGHRLGLTDDDVNGNAAHNVFDETGGLKVVDRDPDGEAVSVADRGLGLLLDIIRSRLNG